MTTMRVGDIADQIRGVTYSRGESRDEPQPGYVPLLRAGNIRDDGISLDNLTYVPTNRVSAQQMLLPNDVLIAASSGSLSVVGKAARVLGTVDATFGAFCKVLRLRANVDPGYFAHYFRTRGYRRYISSVAAGANINNLRSEDLDRIEIPLPPLPEQRRIAAILDEADALRRARLRSMDSMTELPARIFAAFDTHDWHKATVGEIAELQGGLTINRRREALPLKASYLRVANVLRGAIDTTELKSLGVTEAELARTRIRIGDVLMVEGHGNASEVGRAAFVENLPTPSLTHQNHLFRLRPKGARVLGRFLELALNSSHSREYLGRTSNTTSGLNTLNATNVRALPLRIAPPEIQHEIVAMVDQVRASEHRAVRATAELDALFASLEHRAFRGKL